MLKIKEYRKVKDLEEAYELNQKKSACVLGGMVWLKMGNRMVSTAIDLSGLGLDTIEETEEEFRIGAMTSLRALETHQGLAAYTNGAMKECAILLGCSLEIALQWEAVFLEDLDFPMC